MPKSDTWPGGVAMESLSNVDSAGSCDSVISANSGYSEDSMEYLSAEERACLMYLEETIEALEVQEDSGLSNDEPESVFQADAASRTSVSDVSSLKSESEHGAPEETSEPRSSPDADAKDQETSGNLSEPKSEAAAPEICPSTQKPGVLSLSKDEDGNLQIVSSSSEVNLALIPPPSDFMDVPRTPPRRGRAKSSHLPSGISTSKPGAAVDVELLRQRALMRSPVTPPAPEPGPLVHRSGPRLSPPPEAAEPKSPPAVAPKPKRLPANIILKSHKTAAADGSSGHSGPSGSDRLVPDPQRVHTEALRKLGLLKSEERDSAPSLISKLSPQSRRSWAAPSPPVSPSSAFTPPMTPSHPRPSSQTPVPFLLLPPPAPAVRLPDIVPAPAAFSDPDGPDNTPPRTPPALLKQLTPPKGFKAATLERSGLGLADQRSLGQLRNTRPRPASLGSRNDFPSAQVEGLQAGQTPGGEEPAARRSLPAFQHAGGSQKLPRSQGISVLICPRSENGDDRREALKRLGLIRD